MQITFEMAFDTQSITLDELNEFQTLIGKHLPEDYRQHMLTYNGGDVEEINNAHLSEPEGGGGISDFYPIKYGSYTLEKSYQNTNDILPNGYLAIGRPRGSGEIIISLNDDASYGNTKHWFPDGTIYDLSSSFTQLLNDQVEKIG